MQYAMNLCDMEAVTSTLL